MEIIAVQPESGEGSPRFDVGDLVVHPHHGAGRVVSRRRRRLLGGGERGYLEIDLVDSPLKIMVPCESTAAVGLRAVAGPRRLARIVAVLDCNHTRGGREQRAIAAPMTRVDRTRDSKICWRFAAV